MKMRRLHAVVGIVLIGVMAGCRKQPGAEVKKSIPPAKVEHVLKETALSRVTLTPEAEERLGIATAAVASRQIRRTRTVGGDIIVPPGKQIAVSAPLAGTLIMPESGRVPTPGSMLTSGQVVLRLLPAFFSEGEVLPPSDRISLEVARANLSVTMSQAEGDLAAAEVQIEAAKLKLARADKLRQENVGSVQAYEDARAELQRAQAEYRAARKRLDTLQNAHLEAEAGAVPSLAIRSPRKGVLQKLHAVPSTVVAAGEPLFEVAGIDPVWVRVPLYAGDIETVDVSAPARVAVLSSLLGSGGASAEPVTAPPSANADTATVDRFYKLDNPDGAFLPGQRVSVTLSLQTIEKARVVPFSAIVYDCSGSAWLYENTEPHVFSRRRVEVREVAQGAVVLARGPDVGTEVVTTGAAELFGTEFGVGK